MIGATANLIQGNFVGTDVAGMAALGNGGDGFYMSNASANTIGGVEAGARNVISGNTRFGVYLTNGSGGNLVQGNFIGTDATGSAALGNAVGVELGSDAPGNTIGGVAAGAGNLISGNVGRGISIRGSSATDNVVQGNLIGTDASGTAAMGNGGAGVAIESGASNATIGGTTAGAGNIIAYNGGDGVFVVSGTGNRILSNSIFSNSRLGIDLRADGVTSNDPSDLDGGINKLQNFPEIASARVNADADLVVEYTVDSATTRSAYPLRVEFFIADAARQEGETFLGSDSYPGVAAQSPRLVNLGPAATLGVAGDDVVLATATDADGNTSEFSLSTVVTVEPTPIPNISVWGLIALGSLSFVVLFWRLKVRNKLDLPSRTAAVVFEVQTG